jgi:hypothetical protein
VFAEDGKKEDEKKEEGKKAEDGKANGLKKSGGVQELETTLLHEMVLIPFLDRLTPAERAELKKELAVWISTADGRTREKVRVVITPRVTKGTTPDQKEKHGTMRSSASQSKGALKANSNGVTTSDDEGEWEEGDHSTERAIRRGRSFSTVFAKMTGRGTMRDKGGKAKEDEKGHDAHEDSTNSTNSHTHHGSSLNVQSPSVRIIGSQSRKNNKEPNSSPSINGTEESSCA